ncbi:MAG TPA: peptidoglycan-associated lipoprotein Pal [Nevskiales bacterium]|nr:peptidoglycan-associated lipoprotein Pal [Nevskiales bacterium]
MKMLDSRRLFALVALGWLVLAASGCSTTTAEDGGETGETVESGEGGGLGTEGLEDRSLVGIAPDERAAFNDPNNPLSVRVFYFDFDSDLVKPEYDRALQAHADYIKKAKTRLTIRLEGHADERGSREYNIGLGERRGNAIKRILQVKGVPGDQLAVLSYGEERPADPGHSEDAWSKNRRVELIYPRQ